MLLFHEIATGLQALVIGALASLAATLGGPAEDLATPTDPAEHKPQWVAATIPSCDNTCENVGMSAVISGYGGNGEPFYVCAANAHGGGERGGYNYRPNWANACYVGWGGAEEGVTPYKCLCR